MAKFLQEIKAQNLRGTSKLDEIVAQLSVEDGKDLRDAMLDPTIRPMQIIHALKKRGLKLSPSVITRYRDNHNVAR
jgi:aryl carrier-like protein